jgi:Glycosyltransferase
MPPLGRGVDVPALVGELVSDPDSVEIIGEVPDIAAWVASADALILPTDTPEGFGLVLIEAFRAGKPVIASSDGGPGEIVHAGADGWLFKNGDAAGLADILRTLRRTDLAAAGNQALDRYEEDYSPETFHGRLRAVMGPALRDQRRLVVAGRDQR